MTDAIKMKSEKRNNSSFLRLALLIILGVFLNLFTIILVSAIQTSGIIPDNAFGEYIYNATAFMYAMPTGTIVVALLGGAIPGITTSLISLFVPSVMTLIVGFSDVGFWNMVNVDNYMIIAAACILMRNKRALKKKRNIPIAALIILVIIYFYSFISDNFSLYNPILFLPQYIIIVTELFICRLFMSKWEKWVPVRETKLTKAYRKHSIKRQLMLIINLSAIVLTAASVFAAAAGSNILLEKDADYYCETVTGVIKKELSDEIIAAERKGNLDDFDESRLSEIISEMTRTDLRISEIDIFSINGSVYDENYNPYSNLVGSIRFTYSYDNDYYFLERTEKVNEAGDRIKYARIGMLDADSGIMMCYSVDKTDLRTGDLISRILSFAIAVIVVFNIIMSRILDKRIVIPLNNMTVAAEEFAYDTDEHRIKAVDGFKALGINSGDEVEQLYGAITKTMDDMNNHISQIKEQAKHISDMQHNIIITMADIVESRDENTGGHIRRTAEYVRIIADKLREKGQYSEILTDSYIKDMIVAAPLHDMGKIHVSDAILNKPGKLDSEEFAIMKSHTTAGKELLKNATNTLGSFSYLDMAVQMAASHHEKWSGGGYPEGLSGEDIPLCARIMAVADVFDALISKRCYKEPMPLEKAYDIIRSDSGTAFDPIVVDAFFDSQRKIEETLNNFR